MRSTRSTPLAVFLAGALAACGGFGSSGGDGGGGGDGAGGDGGGGGADAAPGETPRYEQLIRGDEYPRLVLEVDSVSGFEPRQRVEEDVAAGFSDILDKPEGIEVTRDGEISSRGSDHAWSFEELDQLAGETFDLDVPDDTIKIHVLFVDGHHEKDDEGSGRVLGLAWAHKNIVLFKQTMEELCEASPLGPVLRERQCRGAEYSVWTHEVGHVIGLVDNGLPMVTDHKDEEHGAHDQSDECVMYWAYNGEAVFDQLREQLTGGGDAELGFGQNCLDDVAAVRDAASR